MKTSVFTTLALALAACSVQAQEFTFGINTGYATVQGTDRSLAMRGAGVNPKGVEKAAGAKFASVSTRVVEDINFKAGSHTPLGINLGLKLGDNSFVLDYMSTSKTTRQTEVGPNLVWGSFGPGGSADRIDGQSKLEAVVLDLKWMRPLATVGSASFGYELGLRYGSWTASTGSVIDALPDGTNSEQFFNKAKTAAYGFTFGLNTRYELTKSLWLSAGVTCAMLQGDIRGVFQMGNGDDGWRMITNKGNHRSFQQLDYRVRLNMAFTKQLSGYLGCEMRDFGKVTADSQQPMLAVYNAEPNRGWGSLNGVTAGLSFTF